MENLSDCLRMELKPFGNGVIVIEPGPIRTEGARSPSALCCKRPAPRLRPAGRGEARPCRRRFGVRPRRLAREIVKAIRAMRPKTRYLVGSNAKRVATVR